MPNDKTTIFFKIAGCISVYIVFVAIVFNVNIQNITALVLVSSLVGSLVVVASYHEYRGTMVRIPAKKKTKAKMTFTDPAMDPMPVGTEILRDTSAASNINDENGTDDDGIPNFDLTLFTTDVLKKVQDLHVDDELQNEIFNALKEISPEHRLKYIDDVFSNPAEFDTSY